MERNEIQNQVIDVIAKELTFDKAAITEDSSLVDDLGADSLDAVEIIMSLEESFEIEIPEDAAMRMKNVKSIVSYIEKAKN